MKDDISKSLLKAITSNGGTEDDINLLTEEMITELGRRLAYSGIKSRMPKSFSIKPINKIGSVATSFDWLPKEINDRNFPLEQLSDKAVKEVEIITCKPGWIEHILNEISERGYEPAEANYLLGLRVQFPDAVKIYKYIICLQKISSAQIQPHAFLNLRFQKGQMQLRMAQYSEGIDNDLNFIVTKKS